MTERNTMEKKPVEKKPPATEAKKSGNGKRYLILLLVNTVLFFAVYRILLFYAEMANDAIYSFCVMLQPPAPPPKIPPKLPFKSMPPKAPIDKPSAVPVTPLPATCFSAPFTSFTLIAITTSSK
jgi:hypothetical protein